MFWRNPQTSRESASHSQLKPVRSVLSTTMYDPPETTLVEVCANYDLQLRVQDEGGSRVTIFRVSKAVLCLASPVWKAAFDPNGCFREAQLGPNDSMDYDVEDSKALEILLNLVHPISTIYQKPLRTSSYFMLPYFVTVLI